MNTCKNRKYWSKKMFELKPEGLKTTFLKLQNPQFVIYTQTLLDRSQFFTSSSRLYTWYSMHKFIIKETVSATQDI
jgi:hypothetical protein